MRVANGTAEVTVIDPRVHYVGMTALRTLKLDQVPSDEIYVLQDHGNPVAVLVPYPLYLKMQQQMPVSPGNKED